MTAEAVQTNQELEYPSEQVPAVVRLELLREQDFGSLELVPWSSRQAQSSPDPANPTFRPQETSEAMALRAEMFLTDFILPLFAASDDTGKPAQECVAVVSHGLFLSVLWQTLLRKFNTPVVFAALPFQFRILAKKELWSLPFIGWYLARSGQMPINTENPRSTLSSLGKAAAKQESVKTTRERLECMEEFMTVTSKIFQQFVGNARSGLTRVVKVLLKAL